MVVIRSPHDRLIREEVVGILKSLYAEGYTQTYLARFLGFSTTIINRYIMGHVTPTTKIAKYILSKLSSTSQFSFQNRILKYIQPMSVDEGLLKDPIMMRYTMIHFYEHYKGRNIDYILCMGRGQRLAKEINSRFSIPIFCMFKKEELPAKRDLGAEKVYTIGENPTLCVPVNKSFFEFCYRKVKDVLFVDDSVRFGNTLLSAKKVVDFSDPNGKNFEAFVIVGFEPGIRRLKEMGIKIHNLYEVKGNFAKYKPPKIKVLDSKKLIRYKISPIEKEILELILKEHPRCCRKRELEEKIGTSLPYYLSSLKRKKLVEYREGRGGGYIIPLDKWSSQLKEIMSCRFDENVEKIKSIKRKLLRLFKYLEPDEERKVMKIVLSGIESYSPSKKIQLVGNS